MKSYKNLYPKLCSYNNLLLAFKKARKNKISKSYVKEFEINLENNLLQLKKELLEFTYNPKKLVKFIIRDPKTRVIRKSDFRDRIIHHAVVNILESIYDKTFIYDSYANRINKGTINALKRFDKFKRKVSNNGKLANNSINNNMVKGYALKGDIKQFFDSVNHDILIKIFRRKIKDNRILWLINLILKNFDNNERGMPLGNMTSQFFANVYLNELDYFVKHKLKAKYYIRYVDDFVILNNNKEVLEMYKDKINKYLSNLKLELHIDKSKIFPIYEGVNLLGFKVFYHYRLLRKRNIKRFNKRLKEFYDDYKLGLRDYKSIKVSVDGWLAYAIWGDTYKLRKKIIRRIDIMFKLNCTLANKI